MAGVDPATLATVFTSSSGDGGELPRAVRGARRARARGVADAFHNSVHNAPAGYWHIAVQSRARRPACARSTRSFGAGLLEAARAVHGRRARRCCWWRATCPTPSRCTRCGRCPTTSAFALLLVPRPARRPHGACSCAVEPRRRAARAATAMASERLRRSDARRARAAAAAGAGARARARRCVHRGRRPRPGAAVVPARYETPTPDHARPRRHRRARAAPGRDVPARRARLVASPTRSCAAAATTRDAAQSAAHSTAACRRRARSNTRRRRWRCTAPGGTAAASRRPRAFWPARATCSCTSLGSTPRPARCACVRSAWPATRSQAMYRFEVHDADGRLLVEGRTTVVLDTPLAVPGA